MLVSLLPPGLDPLIALSLVALSFATSLITATFSLGGGMLMIAGLALVFPPAVVVPLHACVQLGSNGGRAVLQREHIQWPMIGWISLGTVFGVVVGAQLVSVLPEHLLTLAIGIFVLFSVWLPQPRIIGRSRTVQVIGGFVISALSMVVGVTGPLVATFIKGIPDRRQLVATHATLQTVQNIAKVVAFIFIGFAFSSYVPLILAMVLAGFGGTALGSGFLQKIPERVFRIGFKAVLTVIALDLIRGALF